MLFSLDPEHDLTTELSTSSVRVAFDLVDVCNKHAKIIAGRTDTSLSPTRKKFFFLYIILWVVFTTAQTSYLPGKSVIDIGRHCLIPGQLLDHI